MQGEKAWRHLSPDFSTFARDGPAAVGWQRKLREAQASLCLCQRTWDHPFQSGEATANEVLI